MFSLHYRTDLDLFGVVDLVVDVGDLFGSHVVGWDGLTEEADTDLALDVAEANVILGTNTNLKRKQTWGQSYKATFGINYIKNRLNKLNFILKEKTSVP